MKERKTSQISIKITPSEKQELELKAKKWGLTLSKMLRQMFEMSKDKFY